MAEAVAIVQRKLGVRLTFQFGEQLTYTLRDHSGEREFAVPYQAINVLAPSTLVADDVQFFRTLFVVPILAVVACVALQATDGPLARDLGLLAAALIALLYVAKLLRVFAVKYTMLPVSPVSPGVGGLPIRIMEDARHAAILDEIKTRWRGRLKQLHGAINFANDVEKEIAKFSWMKQHAIITEGEYRDAVDKLLAYALHNRPPAAEHTLN